jgi:iron-sulfur cluster insertion protein
MEEQPITLTDTCYEKILDIIIDENNPNVKLRVFVQGGGCSGFQYGFTLDEVQNDDDFVVERDQIKLLIDAMSYQYLIGSSIDYREDVMGSSFVIKNPNATSSCGCGNSFSV